VMSYTKTKIDIDISVQEPEWDEIRKLDPTIREAIERTLLVAPLPPKLSTRPLEVSIVLANDDLLRILNNEYRGKDSATNVLTFANIDGEDVEIPGEPYHLGDIVLSYHTINREAIEQEKFFTDHFTHILVHGVLHVLGYDHQNEDEATVMETFEIRTLEKLGIQNPYTMQDL
jgi:probable rRNA maturation factor